MEIAALIDIVYSLDVHLFRLANDVWVCPLLDHLMPVLSLAGNHGTIWLLLLGAVAAFGKRAGRKVALAGLVALAVGLLCSDLMKELTARPRPFVALEEVRLLVGVPHSWAFPSDHTTSSFAAATGASLAARRLLGKVPIWGWVMLALAVAVSYSRLYVGVHWPTDVMAGTVLGAASGWLGARLILRGKRRDAIGMEEAEGTPAEVRIHTQEVPRR